MRKKVIEMRVMRKGYELNCAVCKKRFRAGRKDARFCGKACGYVDWASKRRPRGAPRLTVAELEKWQKTQG